MVKALVFVTAVAAALAGCGGSTQTVTQVVTQTSVATVTAEATRAQAEPQHYSRFQMPSRNIGCGIAAGVLRCDILSGLNPEPALPCELDWTGVELSKGGAARPQCAGDTVYLKSAPVLSYGQSWSRAGITCFSRRTGLECGSEAGHGFNLARQFWGVF